MRDLLDKINDQRNAARGARAALGLSPEASPDDPPRRFDNCHVIWRDDRNKLHGTDGATVDVARNMAAVYLPNNLTGQPIRRRLGAPSFFIIPATTKG